jgi:glutathione S-transferase/alpha,alpha-trehalase
MPAFATVLPAEQPVGQTKPLDFVACATAGVLLVGAAAALAGGKSAAGKGAKGLRRAASPMMKTLPRIHGSPQSRSPLVNWFCLEAGIDFEQAAPRPSPHPFGQVPCLVDGDAVVFESGAILLYLLDTYGDQGGVPTAAEKAAMLSWVVWANSELDGLCFGAIPGDHRVRGTSMERSEIKQVGTLEAILAESEWLVGGRFTVADAAVASYLNYVPLFFPNANLSRTPAIAKYMKRCAERPAFAQAFGEQHAALVQQKAEAWLSASTPDAGNPLDSLKNMFKG